MGIYVATINHFMFGPLFEKGLSLKAGQTPCQKYWPVLIDLIQTGELSTNYRRDASKKNNAVLFSA